MTDMNGAKAFCLLEGIISVKAAIEGGYRKIEKIYVDENKRKQRDRKIMHFLSFLKEKGLECELMPRAEIDALAQSFGAGTSHGGVVATAKERLFCNLKDMLEEAKPGDYFVYLDGVEDPYNFGYSVRTLYAMGASGFIIPERNWMSAAGAVARASAGASELCKIAVAGEDAETASLISDSGVDIVCSALSASSVSVYDFSPENPFVLFIGGEKRGISKEFMEKADKVVHIPYARENVRYSLPTASVCAIYASVLCGYVNGRGNSEICSDM